MANSHFFEHSDTPETAGSQAPHCIACQALLTDALDGNLGEIDQTWFDSHIRTCPECGPLFADAQRGAAWLDLLKSTPPPEPSPDLMDRILAQTSLAKTSLAQTYPLAAAVTAAPHSAAGPVLSFPSRPSRQVAEWGRLLPALFEPRLAMTAAMALFSLALTMNLTGVQLGQLRPSNLRRTYYQSTAGVARYYDNLRVVQVLESRVDDLREENSGPDGEANRNDQPPSPHAAPGSHPAPVRPPSSPEAKTPKPGNGVSRREFPSTLPSDRSKTLYALAPTLKTGGLA